MAKGKFHGLARNSVARRKLGRTYKVVGHRYYIPLSYFIVRIGGGGVV